MKLKLAFILATIAIPASSIFAEDQTICPIMTDTEIDVDEVVDFEGTTIYLCCGSCMSAWEDNPEYYIKVGIVEGLLPQFESVPDSLKEVELLEQRFCPFRPETVIGPESPSIEYKGKKIYFFKERDIERKWDADPEAAFAAAREAGLLPQFD
ncbi:MAG: hypothetical protein AAGD22_04815 [Verrucomicrobiota bacterium]